MPMRADPVTLLAEAWVHDLNPVIVHIAGPFAVRWYGLAYLAGFALGYFLLKQLAKRGTLRIPPHAAIDALFLLALGAIVGGRIGYALLYQPSLLGFTDTPPFWRLLALNEGGMASHGGMLGVAAATLLIARRHKVPCLHIADAVALAAPAGLLLGRLANFINGELLGRIIAGPGEAAPWYAVRFPTEMSERPEEWAATLTPGQIDRFEATIAPIVRELDTLAREPVPAEAVLATVVARIQAGDDQLTQQIAPFLTARHPSQLYQALAEGLIVFIALAVVWIKPRRAGVVSGWFLIVYGAGRIATEFYRLPDVGVSGALGLSRGQLLSAAMIAAGFALIGFTRVRKTPVMGGLAHSRPPAPPNDPSTPRAPSKSD